MVNHPNDTPFDLLRLPVELRLIIYEEAHRSEPPPFRGLKVNTGTSHEDMEVSLTNYAPNINLLLTSPKISDEVNKILQKDQVLRVELSLTEEFLWGKGFSSYSFARKAQVGQFQRFLCSKIKHASLHAPPTLKGVEIELTIPRYNIAAISNLWESDPLKRVTLAVADKLNELKNDLLFDGAKRPITLEKFTIRLVTVDEDLCESFNEMHLKYFVLNNELGTPKSIEVIHEHAGEQESRYNQEFFDKESQDATRRLREAWVSCLASPETNIS